MGKYRKGTPVTDKQIRGYLKRHATESLTIKGVAKEIGVAPYRVTRVAEKLYKDEIREDHYQDDDGLEWGSSGYVQATFGLTACSLQNLLERTEERGQVIRRTKGRSRRRILGKDFFYCITDIDATAQRLKKRKNIISRRQEVKVGGIRKKPDELTENEYQVLRVLYHLAISGNTWPTISDYATSYNLGYPDNVGQQLKSLAAKDYIEYRRRDGLAIARYEYRLLKGPTELRKALERRNPDLTKPYWDSSKWDCLN